MLTYMTSTLNTNDQVLGGQDAGSLAVFRLPNAATLLTVPGSRAKATWGCCKALRVEASGAKKCSG